MAGSRVLGNKHAHIAKRKSRKEGGRVKGKARAGQTFASKTAGRSRSVQVTKSCRVTHSGTAKKGRKPKGARTAKSQRVALAFLVVCVCSFISLAFMSCEQDMKAKPSALQYALASPINDQDDPLVLSDVIESLRLIGVSQDHRTIGYESDLPAQMITDLTVRALQAKGWTKVSDERQSLVSMQKYVNNSRMDFLLLQCIDVSGGSSLVIKLW